MEGQHTGRVEEEETTKGIDRPSLPAPRRWSGPLVLRTLGNNIREGTRKRFVARSGQFEKGTNFGSLTAHIIRLDP